MYLHSHSLCVDVQVHTDEGPAAQQAITAWAAQTFGGQLAEAPHLGRIKYTLPAGQCSLAAVFRNVESVKEALHIQAYRYAAGDSMLSLWRHALFRVELVQTLKAVKDPLHI